MISEDVYRKVHPKEYLKRFIDKDVRPDGRAVSTARYLRLTIGSINTAVGSALVRLGNTTVLAGVNATLIRPNNANPDKGIVEVSVELLPTASGESRNVRGEEAVVLAEFLRTLIIPHIDVSTLCVEADKLVWCLSLTVYCIDHDGNLEDSVVLAAVAALRNVRLPTVRMVDGDEGGDIENGIENTRMIDADNEAEEGNESIMAVVSSKRTESLELDNFPLTVSFQLFCEKALIDPSAEEEVVCVSRVTFIMKPTGDMRGILKEGGHILSPKLYNSCLAQSKERVKEYMKKLQAGS
ncbi:Exosome complex component RRP43 [Gracilariopsis chorda]|uniref:Ribosomal RNA-processing protein 43 n=1 Tax=Gracilariopsis chorda TaxID=448386 RepID=A0A2V3IJN1_9FLOR|nr:Exosome complex component RRP43 [Gracilariopsis chorda]|eukprot:PXF42282.1 Exosome complex component RRP43 [Gracilariopsis chorda]